MGTFYPTCTTTISPYSDYNSNSINKLTRMVSLGENCYRGTHSCETSIDTTSPTSCLVVTTGSFFKDDCIHSIDEEFTIDMNNEDFYYDSSSGYFNEAGYYFIAFHYVYVKMKPAPRVSIKIFKPSQLSSMTSDYLFLKCVLVSYNGVSFEITSIHDYYPTNPTIKRSFVKTYIEAEDTLPVFDLYRDEGRMIYVKTTGNIYFGKNDGWLNIQDSSSIYDEYKDLLENSVFKRLTAESFHKDTYIDIVNTTAEISLNYDKILGENGEIFQSTNLVDNDIDNGYDETCITEIMIVSNGEDQNYQLWHVTNNGNDANPDWELVTLNEIHNFSTDYIPVIDSTGDYTIGEIVIGSTSGLSGTLVMDYSSDLSNPHLLIYNISGNGVFTTGEDLVGQTSGTSKVIDSGSYKRDTNKDVRVKCIFSGTSEISDYGLFYELNSELVDTVPENQRNIDTLFSDLYAAPSEDNDGLPNLAIPLETCKRNLQIYTGSSGDSDIAPSYNTPDGGNPLVLTQGNSIESALKELDINAYNSYLDSIYIPLLNSSFMERCSYDGFVNNSQINITDTDATYNSTTHTINGDNGELFVSTDLYDTEASLTFTDACQISAEIDLSGSYTDNDYSWFVSNDGTNFETIELNTLHYFSEVELNVDTTGSYTIGEVVIGSITGTTGIYNGLSANGRLLLSRITGYGTFIVGELINGQTSGATGDVRSTKIDRTGTDYQHLYVMCLFGTNGGIISSYGVLYDINSSVSPYSISDQITELENKVNESVLTKTDSYQILISDLTLSKRFRMNSGLGKIFYLPTLASGMNATYDGYRLSFFKQGVGKLTIDCESGFTIMDSADGGVIYSNDDYAYIELEYIHALTKYVIVSSSGTWITA